MHLRRLARVTALLLAAVAVPAAAASPVGRQTQKDPGFGAPAIAWSGQLWIPRVSAGPDKPYTNQWNPAPNSIYVDSAGRLHMWLRDVGGVWTATQLMTAREDLGYGTYTFTVETPIAAMDPNEVLGLYTRNSLPTTEQAMTGQFDRDGSKGDPRYVDHDETDIEIGRWDWAHRGHPHRNAQYVVQPWWQSGRLKHLWLPERIPYTAQFVWNRSSTVFTVWRGTSTTGRPVSRWKSHFSNGVPRLGTRATIDAWLIFGRGAARGHDQEVVLDGFSYVPSNG